MVYGNRSRKPIGLRIPQIPSATRGTSDVARRRNTHTHVCICCIEGRLFHRTGLRAT